MLCLSLRIGESRWIGGEELRLVGIEHGMAEFHWQERYELMDPGDEVWLTQDILLAARRVLTNVAHIGIEAPRDVPITREPT